MSLETDRAGKLAVALLQRDLPHGIGWTVQANLSGDLRVTLECEICRATSFLLFEDANVRRCAELDGRTMAMSWHNFVTSRCAHLVALAREHAAKCREQAKL